jgi:hypothetical protein
MKAHKPQLTWPVVPIDALTLAEDIQTLRLCRQLLDNVDIGSVADQLKDGRHIMRAIVLKIRLAERYAEQKLRSEYLTDRGIKIERKRKKAV